jgi:hypothetical protein
MQEEHPVLFSDDENLDQRDSAFGDAAASLKAE